MFRLIFTISLILPALTLLSQADPDIGRRLEDLQLRIKQLEKENKWLSTSKRMADSIEYCNIRMEIFEAYTNKSQLEFDFKNTTDKISITGLFSRLMQANNPASDILGFRFTDIILSSVEEHFSGQLNNEKDKKRLSQVVSKIISNPLVTTLASSNPITSVVATVISTIVGFTTTSVEMEKEGGRIKDLAVTQDDSFNNSSISAFKNDMQVYINFFDRLLLATQSYQAGMENLEVKYAWLIGSVRNFQEDLEAHLCTTKDQEWISLTRILPEPGVPGTDFSLLLNEPGLRETLRICRKFPALQYAVSDFKNEYNFLLSKFLMDYRDILRTAGSFPDGAIDGSKTDDLILSIENFLEDLKEQGGVPDIFLP